MHAISRNGLAFQSIIILLLKESCFTKDQPQQKQQCQQRLELNIFHLFDSFVEYLHDTTSVKFFFLLKKIFFFF